MAVPFRYVFQQGPVLASLGRTALAALRQPKGGAGRTPFATPSAELHATLGPRSQELVRDYIRHVGGDPDRYGGRLPAHFFPQWGFGLAARTLEGVPYPLVRVLNGGCRVEIAKPLPANEPLEVRARLEDVDDDGRRAVLHQQIVTSTRSAPDAVTAHLYAIVPLRSGKSGGEEKRKEPLLVPAAARELERWTLPGNAGLDFAKLTGDFNPVHWVRPYAKAFGFKSTILHGFGTMARAWEGCVRHLLGGDPHAMGSFDARFTKPLVLPARVGLYVVPRESGGAGGELYVGDAAGSPAYLAGGFTARS